MVAGRQIPDPAHSRFPRNPFRQGYRVQDVDPLLMVLAEWRRRAEAQERDALELAQMPEPPAHDPLVVRGPGLGWSEAQMDWVRQQTFATVRGTSYDTGDVDDFLDEVLIAMAHGRPLPDVDAARFARGSLRRPGYDPQAVDGFLDEIARLRPDG